MSNYEYLLSDINKINGVGIKTAKLLKKKISILYLTFYGVYQGILLTEEI